MSGNPPPVKNADPVRLQIEKGMRAGRSVLFTIRKEVSGDGFKWSDSFQKTSQVLSRQAEECQRQAASDTAMGLAEKARLNYVVAAMCWRELKEEGLRRDPPNSGERLHAAANRAMDEAACWQGAGATEEAVAAANEAATHLAEHARRELRAGNTAGATATVKTLERALLMAGEPPETIQVRVETIFSTPPAAGVQRD